MTANCQPLPRSVAEEMFQMAARALCDRPADTSTQRDARTRQMVHCVLGFEPRDGLEYMLATVTFGHFGLLMDSMSDVFQGQSDALKAKTKTTVVALERTLMALIRQMAALRTRPLARSGEDAAAAAGPKPREAKPEPAPRPLARSGEDAAAAAGPKPREAKPEPAPMPTPLGTRPDTPLGTPLDTPPDTPLDTPLGTPLGTPLDTPLGTPLDTPLATPLGTPLPTPLAMLLPIPLPALPAMPPASPLATPRAMPRPIPLSTPLATPPATPTRTSSVSEETPRMGSEAGVEETRAWVEAEAASPAEVAALRRIVASGPCAAPVTPPRMTPARGASGMETPDTGPVDRRTAGASAAYAALARDGRPATRNGSAKTVPVVAGAAASTVHGVIQRGGHEGVAGGSRDKVSRAADGRADAGDKGSGTAANGQPDAGDGGSRDKASGAADAGDGATSAAMATQAGEGLSGVFAFLEKPRDDWPAPGAGPDVEGEDGSDGAPWTDADEANFVRHIAEYRETVAVMRETLREARALDDARVAASD